MSSGDYKAGRGIPLPSSNRLASLRQIESTSAVQTAREKPRFVPRPAPSRIKNEGEIKVKEEKPVFQSRVQGGRGDRGNHERRFERGNRSERGGRSGNERSRGHDRRVSLSTGKVAFVGSMAAGSSVSSSGITSSMKKPKPYASDAIGISVMDEAFGATCLEVEEPIQWPPVIESPMQPMSLPFGRAPKSSHVKNDAGGAVFCDEGGNFVVSDDELFFIQLPTTLPYEQKKTRRQSNSVSSTSAKQEGEVEVEAADTIQQNSPLTTEGIELYDKSLKTMPAGFLGKINIHKSGKAVLLLGDKTFDIAPSQPPTFYEELVSMDTEERMLTFLGPVKHHLVITPDFESLLS